MVGIDPAHLKSYPHQLSGGMRQRSMIAMAMLFTPDLVIMDEPTSALDVVAQRSLMVQIKELQRELGFAVIFVTHDMSLVSHFSDRLMVMYAGQVAELGATRQVFDSPLHPYSAGLLDAFPSITGPRVPLTGIPGSPPDLARPADGLPVRAALPAGDGRVRDHSSRSCTRSTARWSAACCTDGSRGQGRDSRAAQTRSATTNGAAVDPPRPADGSRSGPGRRRRPLLRTDGLTRHFRIGSALSRQTLHAVDDVSLTIGEREIVALAGESGSGKSTIARLLARIYEPTSGEIYFEGEPLSRLRSRSDMLRYRGQVPMVFQDPFSSINPVFRVSHGMLRGLKLHRPELSAADQRGPRRSGCSRRSASPRPPRCCSGTRTS